LTNKGDVSAIVKSAFGFHIIKLLDIKPESIKSFDEVKDVLLEKVKNDKAQTEFYHLQQKLAEVSFESPDSLDAAADAVGLTIVESDWLTRLGNSTPFNSPKVLDVVFSEAVIKDNVNSDIIEISTDVVMVVHVKAYEESKTKPIADVESEIKTILVTEKSQQLAKEEANNLLTKLVAGDDITSQLTSLNVSFSDAAQTTRTSTSISNVIVRQAFKLPHPTTENLSATVVELNNGDVALVHLLNVNEVELDASIDQSNNQQQTSQLAQSAYRSFVETLKSQATIKKSIGNVVPNS
jgi:peptidyl-prolyl cis-trans isomerase D